MNLLSEKPFTFDRVMRTLFTVAAFAGLFYLIVLLRNALLPFLIAWLLAYLMQPLVRFFQYKLRLKNRVLAMLAALLTVLMVVSLLFIIVVPSVTQEVNRMFQLMQEHNGYSHIPFVPDSWLLFLQENVDPEQLAQLLNKENIEDAVKKIAPQLWTLLTSTFSILFSITIVFVIFLYFVFILLDYEKIANGWIRLIPERYRPFVRGLAEDVEYNMNCYFRGQSLIALCVGVLIAIGFKIVGFPLAVVLGLFIGVLNLIPYMQTIGIIPMVLFSLLKSAETGENFWAIFGGGVVVLIIVQVIQDLFLTPRIMGKAMGMNPAIILLSLSIWGSLLGFIGLIIALPLTTLFLSYYRRFVLNESAVSSPGKENEEAADTKKTAPLA